MAAAAKAAAESEAVAPGTVMQLFPELCRISCRDLQLLTEMGFTPGRLACAVRVLHTAEGHEVQLDPQSIVEAALRESSGEEPLGSESPGDGDRRTPLLLNRGRSQPASSPSTAHRPGAAGPAASWLPAPELAGVPSWRSEPQACPICLEAMHPSAVYRSDNCEHAFHRECFAKHVRSRVGDGQVAGLVCPLCPRAITGEEVQGLVSAESWERYERFKRDLDILMDEGRRHCPTAGCSGVLHRPQNKHRELYGLLALVALAVADVAGAGVAGAGAARFWGYTPAVLAAACSACAALGLLLAHPRTLLRLMVAAKQNTCATCHECGRKACFACGEPWHEGYVCAEVRDSLVEAWAAVRDAARCPNCNTMIERNAGCNHMTCRRGFGGCGYQFCWLCRQEYEPGHFRSGRCPQYGGSPDQDFFRGSYLALLMPAFALLSGVLITEVLLAPLASVNETLWLTALGLAGLVCPKSAKSQQPNSKPLALAVGGPLLGTVLVVLWLSTQHASGRFWASFVGVAALEATGMYADRPPSPCRVRQLLWYLLRRLGSLVVAVGCVAIPVGLTSVVVYWDKNHAHCPTMTLSCSSLFILRILFFLLLQSSLLFLLAAGSVTWRPGLRDVLAPTSWWMGSAGVARVVALAALATLVPTEVGGAFCSSDWGLLLILWLLLSAAASRCALAVCWWRRSAWPLPWLAASVAWGARLCLELLGNMGVYPSSGLRRGLAIFTHVAAGLFAGTVALHPLRTAMPRLAARERQCCSGRRGLLLARVLYATFFTAAGLSLEYLRDDHIALFTERLVASATLVTLVAGCLALELLPSQDSEINRPHGAAAVLPGARV